MRVLSTHGNSTHGMLALYSVDEENYVSHDGHLNFLMTTVNPSSLRCYIVWICMLCLQIVSVLGDCIASSPLE